MSAEPEQHDETLEELLAYLKQSRGFDFTGYKRASLARRIRKRMAQVEREDFGDYQDFLEANPREFTELFDTILINVTGFFRDQPAWDYLGEEIVPRLLAAVADDAPLRVWSAGCASGEEAYSAAITLAEAMGEEAFKKRVKIYATDADEDALAQARQAAYPARALKDVPEEIVSRYFVPSGEDLAFRGDLRRTVIFGRNDMVQDAPISRVDLLICRNTLIYFTSEAQTRILTRFNFALHDHGFLFLGKSEMLMRHNSLFSPLELKHRVFKRVPNAGGRERLAFVASHAEVDGATNDLRPAELRDAASFGGPVAELLLDQGRFLIDANQRARELLGLSASDLGRPLQDLAVSYRPADLRSPLDEALETGRTVTAGRVRLEGPDGEHMLDVEVRPLSIGGHGGSGAAVTFVDVTGFVQLDEQHQQSKRELENAYEELQSTVEELETTNEELQSTNEELETTNEELQSTNEELETMNEELTSTNDELASMNQEQRERAWELDRLNLFLEGIMGNLGLGVVVVDRDQQIQLWNAASRDLWGLRSEEVEGEALYSLDVGLPLEELRKPLGRALAPEPQRSELILDAVNRRGRAFRCAVRVLPLTTATGEIFGALLLMRDADGDAAA